MIKSFEDIFTELKSKQKKRLVAAWAVDDHTVTAAYRAAEMGIVDVTIVGNEKMIHEG